MRRHDYGFRNPSGRAGMKFLRGRLKLPCLVSMALGEDYIDYVDRYLFQVHYASRTRVHGHDGVVWLQPGLRMEVH